MEGGGLVLGVRQSNFKGRDGKTEINMLYVDVYERTCKLASLELVQNPEHPVTLAEQDKITFVVTRQKEANFGGGVVNVVRDIVVVAHAPVQPMAEAHVPPPPSPMPPPPGAPLSAPQPAGAPQGRGR